VLVATYRRPRDLERCLRALALQVRWPDEVLVVVRDTDEAARNFLDAFSRCGTGLPLRKITVVTPGVVAARNAGLAACRTELVAIIDDDTAPYPDWTDRIVDHFMAAPDLGGLGGRDRCYDGERFDDRRASVVGRIGWFGRLVGNHHLGFGPAREVDYLKGANMSFRTRAVAKISFDTRLRGDGAGPHEDMAFSIAVRRSGWKLVYDPKILVDHYPGPRDEPRHYVSIGKVGSAAGFANHAYNIVVALWDDLSPPRRVAFAVWSLLVGTGTCPGLLQALRYTPKLRLDSWRRFWIAQRGLCSAYLALGAMRWEDDQRSAVASTVRGEAPDGHGR
jgi:GT2 family glycosyltransferase